VKGEGPDAPCAQHRESAGADKNGQINPSREEQEHCDYRAQAANHPTQATHQYPLVQLAEIVERGKGSQQGQRPQKYVIHDGNCASKARAWELACSLIKSLPPLAKAATALSKAASSCGAEASKRA